MMSAALPWIIDAVVIGALIMATLATVAMHRVPDLYTKLHAISPLPYLTLLPLALLLALHGSVLTVVKGVLTVAFLAVTTAVSAHVIAAAAYRRDRARRDPSPARGGETPLSDDRSPPRDPEW